MNNQWLTIHVIDYIEIFNEQSMADNSWHSLHRCLTIHGIIYTEGFNKQWLTIHGIDYTAGFNEHSTVDNSWHS